MKEPDNTTIKNINVINDNPVMPPQPQPSNNGILLPMVMVGILLVTSAVLVPVVLSRGKDSKKINFISTNNTDSASDTPITPEKIDKYIDLHIHLDGAITLDIAKKLAKIQNITLPTNNDTELEKLLSVPDDCKSLDEFLKCFDFPSSLMQTKEGLSESVRLVADNIQSQGVIYAELRYAPQNHKLKGMTQEESIQAALDGLKKTSLKANLILCFMRGNGNEAENQETLELAKKYLTKDGGVVGLDLAGAEGLYPTSKYKDLFGKAKEYGIPFTIHAGEAAGADSVKDALDFGAVRIVHGERSGENKDVINTLKNKGIALEMSPTSSRLTHAVEDMTKYPFMEYLHNGIKVTLGTDDMGIERTTIAKEFEYMEKNYGLTYEEKKTLLLNSVDAAFTTDEVKKDLRNKLGF